LDVTQFGAAPYAGGLLSDWGAEVIHVETRKVVTQRGGFSQGRGAGFFNNRKLTIHGN